MKKLFKYIGLVVILLLVLVSVLAGWLALYPFMSDVRNSCDEINVGMERSQVELILKDVMSSELDMKSVEDNQIFLMKNGIDCRINFDSDGFVSKVNSAQDGF